MWGWALPDDDTNSTLPELLGLGDSYTLDVLFHMTLGAICLVTLPWVVQAMSAIKWAPAKAMLTSTAAEREVESLKEGRAAARNAEASALRRLERDIHDGPQQRLVRLSMDLGRASKQAGSTAPELQASIDGALRQTRDALDELRALSRGIAPPVLADRGLRAALEELAVRSSVPVTLNVTVPEDRLPEHAETAAYFVASEALTNVAKHSGASKVDVEVSMVASRIHVRVVDDGRGGAHLSKGKGLLGLSDRVRGVDGVLNVTSPVGGPTVIDAEIPCAS